MPDADFFGKLAGLLNLAAFAPYILAMYGWGIRCNIRPLQKIPETRPNRATWFIWGFLGLVILPSYAQAGAEQAMLWVPMGMTGGLLLVAILSIWRGEGGWSRFDQGCLFGALLSICAWVITGSPVVGLLLALAADGFGAAATIRHAYRRPEEESRLAWSLFFAGDLINLLAIPDWSISAFAVWIYPTYMIAHTGPILALLVFRGKSRAFRT